MLKQSTAASASWAERNQRLASGGLRVSGIREMQQHQVAETDAHRNIENQLCLQVRLVESAMTQPGFARRKEKLLLDAQNTYWGALLTLMSLDKPEAARFAPIHGELRRLRAALTAFKM